MATPPTLISGSLITSFANATTPKNPGNPVVQTGDTLLAYAVGEDSNGGDDNLSVTGGGLVWTLAQRVKVAAFTTVAAWTTTAVSNTTITDMAFASAGLPAVFFGGGLLQYRGSDGVGVSAQNNNNALAPSVSANTQQANSALVAIIGDWSAQDGAARTWLTVNGVTPTAGNGAEKLYFRDAVHYAVYAAVWSDAGAIGSKTVGLSAPGGQTFSIVEVEIKGAVGGTPTFPFLPSIATGPSQAVQRAANI